MIVVPGLHSSGRSGTFLCAPKVDSAVSTLHVRLARWLQPSEQQATLAWAVLAGGLGGISALLFRAAIQTVLGALTGHSGSLEQVVAQLPASPTATSWLPVCKTICAELFL